MGVCIMSMFACVCAQHEHSVKTPVMQSTLALHTIQNYMVVHHNLQWAYSTVLCNEHLKLFSLLHAHSLNCIYMQRYGF